MKYVIQTFLFILSITSFLMLGATTYAPSFPLRQHTTGQKVTIVSIPYSPYGGGAKLMGITKVYYDHKLLYTVDGYHYENIFNSEDGRTLAIIHWRAYTSLELAGSRAAIDTQPAISIYKMGKLYRVFTFKDVIDSPLYQSDVSGYYYYWSYRSDTSGLRCDKEILHNDSMLLEHRAYVDHDCLYVITARHTVLRLDLNNMTQSQLSLGDVGACAATFSPPVRSFSIRKVKWPEHLAAPHLSNAASFYKAVAQHMGMSEAQNSSDGKWVLFASFLLDKRGHITEKYVRVYPEGQYDYESIDQEKSKAALSWLEKQKFRTGMIPWGCDKYFFETVVGMK